MHRIRAIVGVARVLSIVAVLVQSAAALDPNHSITQYGHKAWTRQEGQLPGVVSAVSQTRDGRLWVGTEFGLYHFDGLVFTRWTAAANEDFLNQTITALEPDPETGLWIGVQNALFHWNGTMLQRFAISDNLAGPAVSAIRLDQTGGVWVGTVGFRFGGLARFDGAQLHGYTPADGFDGGAVYSLLQDHARNIWAGCSDGLYQWDGRRFHKLRATHSWQGVISLSEAIDGSIIASVDRGRDLKRLVNGIALELPIGRELPQMRVLLTDRNGSLWIGTNGEGLIHVHQGRIDRFTQRDGLSGNTVLSLFEDGEGNIWTGTEGGLDRFRDLPVATLSTREGLSADTAGSVFASRSGGVWIGTAKGLNRVDGNRVEIQDESANFSAASIGSLFEDYAGRLWVSLTQKGSAALAFRANGRFHLVDLPESQRIRQISAVAQDRDGVLWFSDVERGLILVQGTEVRGILPWSTFENRQAWALEVDRNRGGILLGFAQGGVARFQKGLPIKWYRTSDGLGGGPVTDIQMDHEGVIWIATQEGLSQLRNDQIATLTTKNNLGCNQVHAIVEDQDGALWLNSACGLQRLARSDLAAWSVNPTSQVHPKIYDNKDGMRSRSGMKGFFRRAARSTDGRLWFPVLDGVAVVDPRDLHVNAVPPTVAIEAMRVDDRTYSPEPNLRFGPGVRDVQINYTAFSFVDPERVHFRYKLEGYDQRWRDVMGRRQAFYSHLPPGRYRFQVTASNNDGVWNKSGAHLDFAVAPAFYQTRWFLVLSVITIAGALFGAYRLRLRQLAAKVQMRLEERMHERNRIGRELHDTLLQNISGFALQLDALSKVVKEPQSAKDRARDLRREAEKWLHEVRESVWDLRSYDDEVLDFTGLLRQVGEQTTRGTAIQFQATVSGTGIIPPKLQLHLKRIVQEALRNAVRHSGGTMVRLAISYSDEYMVRIGIIDDGRGFDLQAASAKPGHWGLVTMRERGERLGAEFKITATPGEGTKIEITVPNGTV